MQNDRKITISTAGNRRATQWPAQSLWWSEFVDKLRTPLRGTEALAEYLHMPKSKQDDLKDVGGFVGGTLVGLRRKANAVAGRDLLTLDLDAIQPGESQGTLRALHALPCAFACYSTRKHSEAGPRLRVIFPLSRTITADEYEPAARKMAELIGIDKCDPSTFEASRLMYWPSCSADSQFVFQYADKPFIDADGLLAMYKDWRNVAEWPQVPGIPQKQQRLVDRQEDPTGKPGVVGAFCRIYDICRAMDDLIPGAYDPCDIPGRYTFTGGSTTGGAVVYDDGKFLYSHHATDPAGGQLVNAFDLVRLHKYSEMDDEAKPGTPTNKLPSYDAMSRFAVADALVSTLLNTERYHAATEAFAAPSDETPNWVSKLAVSPTTGQPAKTRDNLLIILRSDPELKGKIALDEFAARGVALGALPWDPRPETRIWTDNDDAGAQWYFERVYQITGKDKTLDALSLYSQGNRFNDVVRYLTSLEWDNTPRLDTLLTDYLGAEDTVYTRAVSRKSLTAATARAMAPGVKYDYMPILSGPQGIGKSTMLRTLGRKWFSDSLAVFDGKEACEMIQGTWINELGELNGMSRAEVNAVKMFLSRTEDIFRVPYGRRTDVYPRRCVFFGTTNDSEFLRDATGNRRFWPVDVGVQETTKSVFQDLPGEVDQIWAEAVMRWRLGEPLYLTGEAEEISRRMQEEHREGNAKEGLIAEFLERPIPQGWYDRSVSARRMYWRNEFDVSHQTTAMQRVRVCAAEVWCECFDSEPRFMKKSDAREINDILASLKGWERMPGSVRFGDQYGKQRGFERKQNAEQSRNI